MTPDPSPKSAPQQGTPPPSTPPTRTNRAGHGATPDQMADAANEIIRVAKQLGPQTTFVRAASTVVATLRQETERLKGELARSELECDTICESLECSRAHDEFHPAHVVDQLKRDLLRLKASNEALVGALGLGLDLVEACGLGGSNRRNEGIFKDAARAAIRQSALATTAGTAGAPTEKDKQ